MCGILIWKLHIFFMSEKIICLDMNEIVKTLFENFCLSIYKQKKNRYHTFINVLIKGVKSQ